MVVRRIARFKIRRHAVYIDSRQVLGEQSHAKPSACAVRVCPEQAQVVVRLGAWMCRIESLEQLNHLTGTGADELLEQWLDLRFLFVRELRPAGWDPRGRRARSSRRAQADRLVLPGVR